jgi:hypothetical protein
VDYGTDTRRLLIFSSHRHFDCDTLFLFLCLFPPNRPILPFSTLLLLSPLPWAFPTLQSLVLAFILSLPQPCPFPPFAGRLRVVRSRSCSQYLPGGCILLPSAIKQAHPLLIFPVRLSLLGNGGSDLGGCDLDGLPEPSAHPFIQHPSVPCAQCALERPTIRSPRLVHCRAPRTVQCPPRTSPTTPPSRPARSSYLPPNRG